jgi:hypothetical protein
MADSALILSPATTAGAGRSDAASGARPAGLPARLPCRAAPTGRIGADPQTGVDAPDYTAFSMVGVAG